MLLVQWRHPGAGRGDSGLQLRIEGIAGLDAPRLVAGHEPVLSLGAGAVGEALRHHAPARIALERVVADLRRCVHRRLDVTGVEPLLALLRIVRPDTGEA